MKLVAEKNRLFQSNRDMALSLIPLVLICIVFAGLASQCSFRPGGPSQGPIPSFDASAALKQDAKTMSFPVRQPQLPADWTPNSGSNGLISGSSGGQYTTVGYITPAGAYLQLTQTSATEETLVPFVAQEPRTATGVENVAGRQWVVYDAPPAESIWVANFGSARVLLRGAGTPDEYRTLAEAVDKAAPIAG
ncbi:DUF4245 domain-containing protein [Skermania sp. ID1734]|uniref:DUF4245 domain-containing protein n=1 Tax=Skermania sp. ID1734 TaxID=2597516 RepID=UPI0011815EB8|nr:DUF4245 domain-containing protein [Skermania sp. ID1734]TSE02219.1 DUF4245 domain-containing protein [Skermania sp. ID1734]